MWKAQPDSEGRGAPYRVAGSPTEVSAATRYKRRGAALLLQLLGPQLLTRDLMFYPKVLARVAVSRGKTKASRQAIVTSKPRRENHLKKSVLTLKAKFTWFLERPVRFGTWV